MATFRWVGKSIGLLISGLKIIFTIAAVSAVVIIPAVLMLPITAVKKIMIGHYNREVGESPLVIVTNKLVIWTRVIAAVGVLAFFASILQWCALRRTDETTREALTSVQRAFVLFKDITFGKLPDYRTADPTGIRFIVAWENSGTTPTKCLVTHVSWAAFSADIATNYDFPDFGGGPDTRSLIGPKTSLGMMAIDIQMDVFRAVQAKTNHLYVWGWADYDDIFNDTQRHRTEFSGEVLVTGALTDAIPGLTFVALPTYNGSDGETMKKPNPCPFSH